MGRFIIKNTTKKQFIKEFGEVFEHSPQFAEGVYENIEDKETYSTEELHQKFCEEFDKVKEKEKLKLLIAHPSLAGKLADKSRLTKQSNNEQKGAGLDNLDEKMKKKFNELNEKYEKKFKFPFIIAVKGLNAENILKQFKKRINHNHQNEFNEACKQVKKIALWRIINIVDNSVGDTGRSRIGKRKVNE